MLMSSLDALSKVRRYMLKTLWIISRFYAEETGTGYSITRTAEGLARYYSVRVLCGQPDYVYHDRRAPSFEIVNGVQVFRSAATNFSNRNLLVKMLNMLTSSVSILWLVIKHVRRNQPVIIVNLPPLLPLLTLPVSRLKGARVSLLVHDVYPDSLVVAGVLPKNSRTQSVLSLVFNGLYRLADNIIVLGRDMQSLLAAKTRWEESRIVVIPNTADVDQIHPVSREKNGLLKKLGLDGKFVVKYAGHMGRTHGLEMLVRGAQILSELDPDIHLVFSGSGPKKAWLESTINCRKLNNVTITSFSPRAEIEDSLNACDIGVISMLPGMAGISVPGRIYDLLAAGKPVIAVTDAHSEIALLIREEKVGWVVEPEDISGLIVAIQSAKADPARLFEIGRRSRWVAENKYARRYQVDAYYQLIERMCNL